MIRRIKFNIQGIIDKFQCPNPACEEMLSIPESQDTRLQRIEIECVCGDTIVGRIVSRERQNG